MLKQFQSFELQQKGAINLALKRYHKQIIILDITKLTQTDKKHIK